MLVLVIGGGIGGLTAAVALRRAGLEVEVFEQAPEIREVGAGITVQCNAVRALAELGLAEGLAAIGERVTHTALLASSGRTLVAAPFAKIEATMGVPAYGVHRADLQRYLLEALGREPVHVASRCTGFEVADGRVKALLEGGRSATGDVLVGADGIRSRVRAQLLGDEPPRYSGYTCWRGVTGPQDLVPAGHVFESWGRGARFGGVGLSGRRFYWFAPVNAPPGGHDEPGRVKAALLERYRSWAAPMPQLIEATDEAAIFRNDIIDRPPVARWGEGPVTLLGDAAHPMTPNLGQGACQAIEDAVILAACLRGATDPPAALRRYEDLRRERTRKIVAMAWRLGRMGHWENGLARWLRDRAISWTPQGVTEKNLMWPQRFPGCPSPG